MQAPRIWLDGHTLSLARGTGIATYTRGMAATLTAQGAQLGLLYGRPLPDRLDPTEREMRFFDAAGPDRRPTWRRVLHLAAQPGGARAAQVPQSGAVDRALRSALTYARFSTGNVPPAAELWNADDMFGRAVVHLAVRGTLMPVHAQGTPPALMHWMHSYPLRLAGTRNIYTLHDLIPMRLPWATLDHKRRWLRMIRAIAASADHILTVSEHARRDIISLLGVAPERVTNTYQAVSPAADLLDPAMSLARLRGLHGLEPRGYWLFLSAIEPRKNLARMLDAYLASGSTRPFVIVGPPSANAKEELRLLTEENSTRSADGRIRHLGFLPRLDVDVLLRHARALLFASLYEGFGLPAVEAMAAGTAVLTSSTTSLPEVVGDAALTVDPGDTRALTEALRALDTDDALRARLEAAGPGRAALFGPEPYAQRLREVHARLGVPLGAREGAALYPQGNRVSLTFHSMADEGRFS